MSNEHGRHPRPGASRQRPSGRAAVGQVLRGDLDHLKLLAGQVTSDQVVRCAAAIDNSRQGMGAAPSPPASRHDFLLTRS
ncbi:hypothetical protein [Streptomyces sp. NPDC020917]|uniref:hypothetical protein n=1 Tax=Streptomyces sp. NPDC020917 TaxID=3365102 RepID=UPI0037AB8EFC